MPTEEQLQLIFKKLGYWPSEEQWAVHRSPSRIRLVAGGERSGKSKSSAMDATSRLFEGKLFWLVAADYERTRPEFGYICEALDKLKAPYEASKRIDPGEITVAGGIRIVTKSGKDPRTIAAEAPDGILACEASQLDYETFLRLRGRVAEKRGWLLMSGTFESSLGWYPEMYNRGQAKGSTEIQSFSLPTWSNLAIYPGGRQDPEILALERESTPEWFMERYGGVPCPPQGIVFIEFRNAIHTGIGGHYNFDPKQDVYLWVDPGYATFYSVLVIQKRGEDIYVVDEVYERGLVTPDIIKVCQQKPWWNRVVGGSIDVAGTQHQAMAAPAEVWMREGGVTLNSRKILIRDGIEVVKRYLIVNPITNQSLLHINTNCRGLISEMGGCPNPLTGQTAVYRWRQDKNNVIIGDAPEDKNNHSCKALAYGLIDLCGYSNVMTTRKVEVKFF